MDWNLWGPVSDQAPQESNSYIQGSQCDFYYGYGLDPIREGNLNKKSVIQVLRIWITKADNDILELEEDLITLQNQLYLADNEWSRLCSSTLKEKIKRLDISIQRLKNGSIQDDDNLQLPREPAENIHDFLIALLRSYSQQKVDKQSLDVVAEESSSERSAHANKVIEEEKGSRISASDTIRNDELKEISTTNAGKKVVVDSFFKPETAIVKYSSPNPTTGFNREKSRKNIDTLAIKETEAKSLCSKSIFLRPFLGVEASNSNPKQSKETEATTRSKNIANSSLKKYERRITNPKHRVTILQLELQNHQNNNIKIPQSKKTQTQPQNQIQETETTDSDEETNSDSSIQPRRTLTKKRKISQNSEKELIGLDISLANTTGEGSWLTDCHLAAESAIDSVKLLPCPNVVDYLTLVELRAIGKQQRLKGYYKLRKADLARKLGLDIHGGRSKGKRAGAGMIKMIREK